MYQTRNIAARAEPLPWRGLRLPNVFTEGIVREGQCHFLLHGCCLQVIFLCHIETLSTYCTLNDKCLIFSVILY